jgi:hypothetical protein
VNWWERLVEWYRYPWGRCSRHGCPINARSCHMGREFMELEYCPQCEDEEFRESQAKWACVGVRSLLTSSVTPVRIET